MPSRTSDLVRQLDRDAVIVVNLSGRATRMSTVRRIAGFGDESCGKDE